MWLRSILDQDQISKYISDELQIPQILLWCNEIDVLVRAGFLEQLQSSECWDRAANSWGLPEADSGVQTQPRLKVHISPKSNAPIPH